MSIKVRENFFFCLAERFFHPPPLGDVGPDAHEELDFTVGTTHGTAAPFHQHFAAGLADDAVLVSGSVARFDDAAKELP